MIGLVVLLIFLTIAGLIAFNSTAPEDEVVDDNNLVVSNFNDCVNAGYEVIESHPRQCKTPEGEIHVEDIDVPVGGDRDEKGCIGSAGYSWDEDVGACTRVWEIKEEDQKKAALIAVKDIGWSKGLTIIKVLVDGCQDCFTVRLSKDGEPYEILLKDWKVVSKNKIMYDQPAPTTTIKPSKLTLEQARKIAQESVCMKEGSLKDDHVYNSGTKTWWIDLDVDKPGCKPACVISEQTEEAHINWRCTGALP